ncbi:hypothetical protein ACFV7Q_31740 [Streptomyces sp. NPDC059851]|uniref:hypothetical protein n=1 Tax=Streptomyces sp. NPDC059851 TaxID=3346971 RepID=UPI003653ABA3
MREERRSRAGLVLLAVALPLVVTVVVMAVVFAGTGSSGTGPLHRTVHDYLDAVGRGGAAPAAGTGNGCTGTGGDPTATLRGLVAAPFEHRIVSSTESGGTAEVNVDLTPPNGAPVAVVLELRRAADRWDVCAASTGRVVIDPF